MTDIIIPIKHLSAAKTRLACQLSPDKRAGLVLAMLQDLLTTITGIGHRRIWIVTSDRTVVQTVRRFNVSWVPETRARGYNAAVTLGIASVPAGSDIAIVPGDIPLAKPDEIARLIAPTDPSRPTVRLVPSRDRQGTNGLFMSANARIEPGFGPGSFKGHTRRAMARHLEPTNLEAPGMALDIDTPADLLDLSACAGTGVTGRYLLGMGLADDHDRYDRGAA
ncbi:MAG: 2-phospho-L-lactate guanylyltransferase [Alphaproteobacteria bacterium]|nr:2-phospho-L-lactate guanylyltransferase [Alphaproteobacteria bacterium]